MERDPNAPPFLPVPPAVWAMVLAMLGLEAALQLGAAGLIGGPQAVGWRLMLTERMGWSGALWAWAWETGRLSPAVLARMVTFPWLHEGPLQALLVAVLLLALGKAVGSVLGTLALWAVVLGGGAVGAVALGVLWPEPRWLVGGLPAVFALAGAFLALLRAGLVPAWEGNRGRVLGLVAVLVVLRIAVGLALGEGQSWIADLAALATGWTLAHLIRPGGPTSLLARLRRR